MAQWIGRMLAFGYRETAWSRRTSGFPIYAFRVEGEEVFARLVGRTSNRPFGVELPEGYECLVRYYETGSGHPTLTLYYPDGREEKINSWNATELVNHEDPIIRACARRVALDKWPEWVRKEE